MLFYFPLVSKSMLMTFMPLVEVLAERGHEVAVIVPIEYESKQERVDVITIDSDMEGRSCTFMLLFIIKFLIICC